MVDADELGSQLVVRQWQFGDRVRPIGLEGSQKLQDLFINRKVPRRQRSRVPIVATPDGQIVWVVGLVVDRGAAVKASTRRVIILKATHPGGKA
jgi:tRNA(Ile)-lysidine synthase